jgi:ElaB/YqjD/DUF883 family membrane-anchored ribosome-binding protein
MTSATSLATASEEDMNRFGNGGEALRDKVEEGARVLGDELEHTYQRARDRAVDMGGRAVGYAKDHPMATIGTLVAGVGIGFLLVRLLRH